MSYTIIWTYSNNIDYTEQCDNKSAIARAIEDGKAWRDATGYRVFDNKTKEYICFPADDGV